MAPLPGLGGQEPTLRSAAKPARTNIALSAPVLLGVPGTFNPPARARSGARARGVGAAAGARGHRPDAAEGGIATVRARGHLPSAKSGDDATVRARARARAAAVRDLARAIAAVRDLARAGGARARARAVARAPVGTALAHQQCECHTAVSLPLSESRDLSGRRRTLLTISTSRLPLARRLSC